MDNVLSFENLSAEDERHIILSSLSLNVKRGEKVALVGESGSGKTMSIRCLLSILPDDVKITEGDVKFSGKSVLSYSPDELRENLYRHIGFVAQNTSESLHPLIKISSQMTDFYLERHKDVKKKEALERAREILLSLGLEDVDRVLSSRPGQLSGGMKQRINIAIALMDDIKLLIADEPTSALDAHIRRQIEGLYISLLEKKELAMLIISHDLKFVRRFADRVYVMYGGKIVEEGLNEEIFSHPVHPYTKALISLNEVSKKDKSEYLAELGGYAPLFSRASSSCAFASLCRYEKEKCLEAVGYKTLSDTHYVRCIR